MNIIDGCIYVFRKGSDKNNITVTGSCGGAGIDNIICNCKTIRIQICTTKRYVKQISIKVRMIL